MNLMIDLETLDTAPTSVVLSIGAVFFDRHGLHQEFYTELNFESQLLNKRTQSQSTMNWWLNQTTGRKFNLPTEHYSNQLENFRGWMNNQREFNVWGNGSNFDIAILEDMFKSVGIVAPWQYWHIRDLRTFREFVAGNERIERDSDNHHNALTDAKDQARYVVKHCKARGIWTNGVDSVPF